MNVRAPHGRHWLAAALLVMALMAAAPPALEAQSTDESPAPTVWPFLAAVATTGLLIGSVFTPWALVYGSPPVFVTLVGWFWPKHPPERSLEEATPNTSAPPPQRLAYAGDTKERR